MRLWKWRHATDPHIDMQRHQFLHRGTLAAPHMKQLMEIMQALGVRAQQPGMNAQPFPQVHLAFVHGVGLDGETRITCRLPVRITNTQSRIEFVRGEVEDDDPTNKLIGRGLIPVR